MKTTLDLPEVLINELKARAECEGRQFDDAVTDLLRKGLAADKLTSAPKPTIKTDPRSGFPYIECPPEAPARAMTTSQLIALEDDILSS